MNKNAIQKYAIWARNELIEQVKQRAYQYGISEKGYGDENATVIAGRVLFADEKRQRSSFINEIKKSGYKQAVEEVAYTWFNRFVALRYMEVNDFLPTHVRVFTDPSGSFKPEILTNVLHLDLPGLDKAKVSELLNANATEELYRYLLLTQCNALNLLLPEMFERMGAYTEMLLPNNILKPESVIGRLVKDIPEEDFRDAVQIIGWLYQYYNTEPKQAVFDGLKKNVKITKENIPAATQLFTPDWIVRYMVENSLGRLYISCKLRVASCKNALESYELQEKERIASERGMAAKFGWKYYIPEAEQSPEVRAQLNTSNSELATDFHIEDVKILDPCMGSGHILVYAFDVLMQIYTSEGYSERDAAKLILEKNLYGLEIDRRAFQLAYFALMMKARQYNRRILTLGVRPQMYEPTGYADGMEYGSLAKVDVLLPKPEEPREYTLFTENYENALNAWNFKRLLARKYDVIVTNPPYMGGSGMSAKLSEFVKKNYPDSKNDLFAVFIERGLELIKTNGYNCMVTMQSWMFLSSFETMRKKLLSTRTITNLLHMENMVMGIAFGTVVANLYGRHIANYKAQYNYMTIKDIADEKPVAFPTAHKRNCTASVEILEKMPGCPVAYWVSEAMLRAFEVGLPFGDIAQPRQGMATSDNNRFLRLWYEVENTKIGLGFSNAQQAKMSNRRWFPYNKGGSFRKWYGNNDYLIDWANDGSEIKQLAADLYKSFTRTIKNIPYYFRESITWTLISSASTAFRYKPQGHLFDVAGMSMFPPQDKFKYIFGFSNTVIVREILMIIAPTLNYQAGDIAKLPIIFTESTSVVDELVDNNISLSRADWDAFETSWDFKRHPLICGERSVAAAFGKWEHEAAERFDTLKQNEEELNRIFIDIYGLSDELRPEVEEKDVTVRRADLGREIRSLISYALGCMFGRYSLDVEGLVYAGGEWDAGKFKIFPADKDNIIAVCDDEYFDDDIAGRFVGFMKTVYGADTLEENLKFIADALGGKGTPREVIRSYFLNDFYKDHCKIYQKRPIYWLFDSGKKNGFKALIYMHRYSRDLLAKLRTDYAHEQQERYRTQLSHIASALNTATGAERARLLKQQDKLSEQAREIGAYEEKVHHLADQNITIDLDDGVKKNYEIFADVLTKI